MDALYKYVLMCVKMLLLLSWDIKFVCLQADAKDLIRVYILRPFF